MMRYAEGLHWHIKIRPRLHIRGRFLNQSLRDEKACRARHRTQRGARPDLEVRYVLRRRRIAAKPPTPASNIHPAAGSGTAGATAASLYSTR